MHNSVIIFYPESSSAKIRKTSRPAAKRYRQSSDLWGKKRSILCSRIPSQAQCFVYGYNLLTLNLNWQTGAKRLQLEGQLRNYPVASNKPKPEFLQVRLTCQLVEVDEHSSLPRGLPSLVGRIGPPVPARKGL
jgi:hypothetical protein